MAMLKALIGMAIVGLLVACGGGGGNASAPTTSPTSTASQSASVATILLTAPSPQTITADGTSSITITVRALDASNGLVKGAAINLGASGGSVLSSSVVTTDASSGLATVTLVADPNNRATRIATITAQCTGCAASPATMPIQINGASLTLTSGGGAILTAGGSSVTLSAQVTDAAGVGLSGVSVVFASTDPTVLSVGSLAPTADKTDRNGVLTTTVSGLAAGTASVTATALGNAKAFGFTVNAAASGVLAIQSPSSGSAMVTNIAQTIVVNAPGATGVNFASTLGTFSNFTHVGNQFTADLTASQAGSATVTVLDNLNRSSSVVLKVSPPVAAANKIILSASQTTIQQATSTSAPGVRLVARALYSAGASDQGVANVPILFTMVGGPGAGEYLTPAYQLTDSSGYAYADFYAGTSSSRQDGIRVDAQIQGTAIATGTAPSSNPALLTIGGRALSVAFGPASVLRESIDKTLYIQDYSVQVTDASNNPVANSVVTLRVLPVAFSTGVACTIAATYCSEDANANGSLDAGEDGVRVLTTPTTTGQCPSTLLLPAAAGTLNGLLTPQNSMGGAVPATVITDSTGTAAFSLTYLKASALWVVDKMTATVSVNGTESGSSTVFRLPASKPDTTPDCQLPDSPFSY